MNKIELAKRKRKRTKKQHNNYYSRSCLKCVGTFCSKVFGVVNIPAAEVTGANKEEAEKLNTRKYTARV